MIVCQLYLTKGTKNTCKKCQKQLKSRTIEIWIEKWKKTKLAKGLITRKQHKYTTWRWRTKAIPFFVALRDGPGVSSAREKVLLYLVVLGFIREIQEKGLYKESHRQAYLQNIVHFVPSMSSIYSVIYYEHNFYVIKNFNWIAIKTIKVTSWDLLND